MAYGAPSVPTGPYSAIGVVTNVEARTKAKKAGGTFTVNIATLDTGAEVDFGFKPVSARVGDSVSWTTMKEYGSYKFQSADPSAGSYPPCLPPRGTVPSFPAVTPVGAPSAAPKAGVYSTKPFPLPREHGDTAIIRQNALTNAVATTGHWGASSKAATLDELSDAIIKLAYKYANFSSGNLDAILADELAERTKSPSGVAGIAKATKAA